MKNKKTQLEKLLKSLAEEAKPDKNFEKMLQHKLKEKFAETHSGSNTSSSFMRLLKFKLQFATALVVILFTSTTIYAYESDAVTNGHILYPLKRTVEKVEGVFANSPEKKSGYYHKMAKRRMRELENFEKRGVFDEETAEDAETMLTYAEAEIENIPEDMEKPAISPKVEPATPGSPMPEEMAVPQIMIEQQPKNKREIKKEEILKTHEEFKKIKKKFGKKIEEKIEDQKGDPKKESRKEILKNELNKKQNKKTDDMVPGTQGTETKPPSDPKTQKQPIPKPVSGPYTKLPKMNYGDTSIINLIPDQKQKEPNDYDENIPTI